VTSANAAVKLCPLFSPSVPVWSFPLSEPSPFAPVVVASLGAVFFVTGGPGAFVSGVAAFGSANTSVCAGQFGSALGGALAMVSFVAGTVPALMGVALLGRFFGKSHGRLMRGAAAGLFVLNGVVLAVMAVRMLG
jgi:hypothetical protein